MAVDFSKYGGVAEAPVQPAAPKVDFSKYGGVSEDLTSQETNINQEFSDEPSVGRALREAELFSPYAAKAEEAKALGISPDRKAIEDQIYGEYDKIKANDPKLKEFDSAYQQKVERLAKDKTYDHLADYYAHERFATPEERVKFDAMGISPDAYLAGKKKTAFDVYAYRTRNHGSPFATSPDVNWREVGHDVKESAKEGFGILPAARGAGYLAQNTGKIINAGGAALASGIELRPEDEKAVAEGEIARREIQGGALRAGAGLLNMGVGGKRFYERNFPKWLGGRAGWWFGGADDMNQLSDEEIQKRFDLDLKTRPMIQEDTKLKNFVPTGGDQTPGAEIIEQAGGAPSAGLSGLRFGVPRDDAGNPLPELPPDEQRLGDVSTANIFASIPVKAFDNPLTRGVAGKALQGIGATGNAVSNIAGRIAGSGVTRAASAFSALSGNLWGFAGLTGDLISKGIGKVSQGLKNAGSELISNSAPATRQNIFATVGKDTSKAVAAGTVGSLPLAVTADTPDQAIGMILGGALLGGTEALKIAPKEALTKSVSKAGARNELITKGKQEYGFGNDADNIAALNALPKHEQDSIYAARGFLKNLRNEDGSPVQVNTFTPERYEAQMRSEFPEATPEQIQSRGYKSKDGNIYLNVGSGSAGDTAGHEMGHRVVDDLANVVMPEMAKLLQSELANSLYTKDGKPIESFQKFAEKYGEAMGEPLDISAPENLPARAKAESEFVAETMRGLLQGRSVGDYAVPKSVAEHLKNGWESFLSKIGIQTKGRKLEEFDFQEIPKVTGRLEDILFEVGKDSFRDEPPISAGARTKQIDSRLAEIRNIPQGKVTPEILSEGAKLAKEKSELQSRLDELTERPEESPAQEPAEQPTESDTSPVVEVSEPFADIGLDQAQIDGIRDEWILPQGLAPKAQRANSRLGTPAKSAEKQIAEKAKEFDKSFEQYSEYLRKNGLKAPSDPDTMGNEVAQEMLELSLSGSIQRARPKPKGNPAAPFAEISGEAAPVATETLPLAEVGRETPKPVVEPREETNRPGPDVTAEEARAVTAVAEAEKAAAASPEYAKKRNDKTRSELITKARTKALLDLLPENTAEPDLLQPRKDEDGSVVFKGKLDTSRPIHRLLAEQLGLQGKDIANIEAMQNAEGALFVDYLSAKNQDPADTTGKQRKAEYAANAPSERGYGNGTIQKNKAIIPTSTTVTPAGKVIIRGVSVDKYIANMAKLLGHLKENPNGHDIPYDGDINNPKIARDLAGRVANEKNGYRPDGLRPMEGATVNPEYIPYQINTPEMLVMNAAFNHDVSTKIDSKNAGTREKAFAAQEKAHENEWPVDTETGDTNALRAELNKSGKFVKTNAKGETRKGTGEVLESVWEALSPDMILEANKEASGERDIVREFGLKQDPAKILNKGLPNWENVSAGFMPESQKKGAFSELSELEKDRLKIARNVIHDKPGLLFGKPEPDAFETKEGFVYRILKEPEIQDAKQHGFYRPAKKAKGGQSNVKFWVKGGEQWWNTPAIETSLIVEVPASKISDKPGEFVKFEDAKVYRGEKGKGFKEINLDEISPDSSFMPKSKVGVLSGWVPNIPKTTTRGVFANIGDEEE